MKNKNESYKPKRIIDGYQMKKHHYGGFKILEYFHYSNETSQRKRVIVKHLTLSEAEDKLYKLENNIS